MILHNIHRVACHRRAHVGLLAGTVIAVSLARAAAPPSAAAVAAPDRYGARAALEVLQAGGNAVDAAVAEAFALAVTYPQAGNLGGGGFMTLVFDGQPYFLDYRERAPGAATREMYLDDHGEVVPERSLVGAPAAGVPGTVSGLWLVHERFGKLPWSRDLQPAIRYARDGIPVSRFLVDTIAAERSRLTGRTNFEAYFGHLAMGQRWRQPELADTLARIARNGVDGFYSGVTGDRIVAQMSRGGGLITHTDLLTYRAVWREPLVRHWRDFDIVTAPLPSSGGISLIQLLEMKDDLAALFEHQAQNSAQYLHLLAEIEKRVFADRAEYLGDPAFVTAPVSRLIDPDYLKSRAQAINPLRPTATDAVAAGVPESHHTTHFSIIDHQGNAVSNTYTLNDDFGSGVVVAGAGFLLNDEMDDFSAKPGASNFFGVVGNDANAIEPRKRPLSSMTPTILLRDGRVALVIGTPGGSRIYTSIFQVLCNLFDFQMPLAQALASPRLHHQLLPPDTLFEEPFAQVSPSARAELAARGYRFENQGWNGDIEAIRVEQGHVTAASDPRMIGVAKVVH